MKTDIQKRISELNNKQIEIQNKLDKLHLKEKIKIYEEHKMYVGKCYKNENKYYKVISQYSSNTRRLTCITFEINGKEDIIECQLSYRFSIDSWLNFIDVEDVFVFGNSSFFEEATEITNKEFNEEMNKLCKDLLKQIDSFSGEVEEYLSGAIYEYMKEECE